METCWLSVLHAGKHCAIGGCSILAKRRDHVACLPGLDGDRIDVFIEAMATAVSAEGATGVDECRRRHVIP